MGITSVDTSAQTVQSIIGTVFPDKTEDDKARFAALLTLLQTQAGMSPRAAQGTDPLQYWRGALGWVCVTGYFWNFVGGPLMNAVGLALGHPLALPSLDLGPLATLTLGMLGLGGLHVVERVKGAT